MSKLIDNSNLAVGADVSGGIPNYVLYVAPDGTLGQDAQFQWDQVTHTLELGNTAVCDTTSNYLIYSGRSYSVGFLQLPYPHHFYATYCSASNSFSGLASASFIIQDEASASSNSLYLEGMSIQPTINHTSGTYLLMTGLRIAPNYTATSAGIISNFSYINIDSGTLTGTESVTNVYGIRIGQSLHGTNKWGYFNNTIANNKLGATTSKNYFGSNNEIFLTYDSDNYLKISENLTTPLGFWVNAMLDDLDFISSGETDQDLFHVDASSDNVGFGTSAPQGKVDIRPLSASKTGLYMQIASTPTVPYVLFKNSTSDSILQIRRGPGQSSDIYPQIITGNTSTAPLFLAIIDFIPNSTFTQIGIPSTALISTDTSDLISIIYGFETNAVLPSGAVILLENILGNDTSSSLSILQSRAILSTGIWSGSSNPFKTIFLTCPTGDVSGYIRLSINSDTGVVVNEERRSDCDFIVQGTSFLDLLFCDVSANRIGVKTNTPSTVFDIALTSLSDNGLQIRPTNANHTGDIFRVLNSAGTTVSLLKLNPGDSSNEDLITYFGEASTAALTQMQAGPGSFLGVFSSTENPFLFGISKNSISPSILLMGIDSGSTPTTGQTLGVIYSLGNDTTTSVSIQPIFGFIAGGNWSDTSNPTDLYLATTPSGADTAVVRTTIKSDGRVIINENLVSTADFIVNGVTGNLIYGDSSTDSVGINTNSPFFDLDVNGDIRVRNENFLYFGGSGGSNNLIYIKNDSSSTQKIEIGGVNFGNNLSMTLDFSYKFSSGITNQIAIDSSDATDFIFIKRPARRPSSTATQLSILNGTCRTDITGAGNVGTGEDTLSSFNYDALLDTNNDAIVIEAWFTFASNANSKRARVYFGSNLIYDSGAQVQNGGSMRIVSKIIRTGAATQICISECVTNCTLFNTETQYRTTTQTMANTILIKSTGEGVSNNDIVGNFLGLYHEHAGNIGTAA